MTFRISGFGGQQMEKRDSSSASPAQKQENVPRKSLVQVRFPDRNMDLTYFNDQFDLKVGNRVYVDGKLEGQLGRITDISYNFKIKLSDYQKVIAVADTDVHGQFYLAVPISSPSTRQPFLRLRPVCGSNHRTRRKKKSSVAAMILLSA